MGPIIIYLVVLINNMHIIPEHFFLKSSKNVLYTYYIIVHGILCVFFFFKFYNAAVVHSYRTTPTTSKVQGLFLLSRIVYGIANCYFCSVLLRNITSGRTQNDNDNRDDNTTLHNVQKCYIRTR